MWCFAQGDSARYTSGTLPTRYAYTGQYSYANDFGLVFYGSRFYDPLLARWTSPDSDVPESQGSTLGFDRYAFVANNPLKYVDPSGHCWGVASAIRGIPGYGTTCNNLDMALSIVQHSEASLKDKALAGGYIVLEAGAHTALAIGSAGLACAVAGPGCAPAVESALGIGTSVSLDGDPTNEALAARLAC